MVRLAYLECPTGIAGDMCLGALIDAGVPWQYLVDALASLGLQREYQLRTAKVNRNGQLATKVHVDLLNDKLNAALHHHHHSARHLPEIVRIINQGNLTDRARKWSLQVFEKLAIAEGAVHGIAPEKVHFHEVGATDAIVDIVGTCIGLDWLDIEQLYCSPLPTGGGIIEAAHGKLPVPVPAVVKLWESRQVPVYSNGIEKELVTPTGAAIATTLAVSFGSPPTMSLEKIGLGAGSRDLAIPNILRLWIGETTAKEDNISRNQQLCQQETITILETQIDDLTPQAIAFTTERLLEAGVLDVFTQAISMKKSRLGILLTVICYPQQGDLCRQIIFRETTTLGIRERTQSRSILNREIQSVNTEYGTIKLKIASWGTGKKRKIINIQPEYEDCAALARKHNISWREIHQTAVALWQNML
ncbi:MAG: nickel pincer cofactor biosynthesis protein LarC [Pleurocapsa sp.]